MKNIHTRNIFESFWQKLREWTTIIIGRINHNNLYGRFNNIGNECKR